jgi:hypothetical protein
MRLQFIVRLLLLSMIATGFTQVITAQKITGTVFSESGDLLPYSSITIKGSSHGTSANNKANFSLTLAPGNYTLVCQHVGYAATEKNIDVKGDMEVSFILKDQKLTMSEVVVKTGAEDPAYEIIRQAIKKREYYRKQVNAFTCELYSKDQMKLKNLPTKILGQKIKDEDRKDMHLDSAGQGIIYLSESISRVNQQLPDKLKLEVKSSRVSGSDNFGFTFPTFISFYVNNVTVFLSQFNPRGFVSPIADNAIYYYKFKFLGTFWENGQAINSIKVIPRRNYEPLFSGTINITDGDWRIHSLDLKLDKNAQLEIMDTLHINQIHVPVTNDVWRIKSQVLSFDFNQFGIRIDGAFLNVYSDYNIDPKFDKKFFDRVIIKYDTGVNKKSVAYWDSVRPVPLEREEMKDYHFKDSLFKAERDSGYTKATIDSLRKQQGGLKPWQVFWSGIRRTHFSKAHQYTWAIESLIRNLEYNPAEGLVLNTYMGYYAYWRKLRTNVSLEPSVRYGFSNTHLNAWTTLQFRTNDERADRKPRRFTLSFSGGKRVSEFNKENSLPQLVNSLSVLLYGDNLIKTYENYFGSVLFNKRYDNGLQFRVGAVYEDRIPLENSTWFTFFKDSARISPNYPNERIDTQFLRHQALQLDLSVSFKPGQRYIQFPYSRISLGSNYPTFTLRYVKGIPNLLGSDVDFDKWQFYIDDTRNFKLAGTTKYKIGTGGFLNTKKLYIQDYQHFNGNRSIAASEYVNSFQLAKYYANSTTADLYGFLHLEHHLNGLLTNKVPILNKLKWNMVVGTNSFYVNRNSNYAELFVGLENIFKLFRVDMVWGFENGKQGRAEMRIGTGGILGGNVKAANGFGNRERSISLF